MAIGCIYCIATKGLKGSEIASLPQTEEEFMDHIEMTHDLPVGREGETEEQTTVRFKAKNKRAGGPDCQCPACLAKRGRVESLQIALVDSYRRL